MMFKEVCCPNCGSFAEEEESESDTISDGPSYYTCDCCNCEVGVVALPKFFLDAAAKDQEGDIVWWKDDEEWS